MTVEYYKSPLKPALTMQSSRQSSRESASELLSKALQALEATAQTESGIDTGPSDTAANSFYDPETSTGSSIKHDHSSFVIGYYTRWVFLWHLQQ